MQTSEADSLNNVTGSIATSLGLVDIVVLDDNQQYILQENQEQTEFILPELSSGESHFGAQVITTQHNTVIPQGLYQIYLFKNIFNLFCENSCNEHFS